MVGKKYIKLISTHKGEKILWNKNTQSEIIQKIFLKIKCTVYDSVTSSDKIIYANNIVSL